MGKHAYLIMAYDRWEQLGVLISLLDDKRNVIFLHINALTQDVPFDKLKEYAHDAKINILERFPIFWGDYSITNCVIQSMKTILKSGEFDYIHFLSGMDLPIKTQDYIHNFFDKNSGHNFINTYPLKELPDSWYQRVSLYNIGTKYFRHKFYIVRKLARGIDKIGRKIQILFRCDRVKKICESNKITIMGGATWFSITEELASKIIEKEEIIKEIFSRYTIFADEMFVQTIAWSYGFENTIFDATQIYKEGNASLRLIDWERGNPYVWTINDINELKTSDCLFARKFDLKTDWDAILYVKKMLDETDG